jgi:hypothetical protein
LDACKPAISGAAPIDPEVIEFFHRQQPGADSHGFYGNSGGTGQ